MDSKRFERSHLGRSSFLSRKRLAVTGLVVLMVLVAGCGGNANDDGTTTGGGTTQTQPPTVHSGTITNSPASVSSSTTAVSTGQTAQSGTTTGTPELNVSVMPTTSNTTNVALVIHATMTDASASNGMKNVTIDTGGGLDFSNLTVANVSTVGIDNGGTLSGNDTDRSLAAHVERNVKLTDNGTRLTIPLDGNESIKRGDELVAVIKGGVETKHAGQYSLSLTIDGGPSQTGNYTLT